MLTFKPEMRRDEASKLEATVNTQTPRPGLINPNTEYNPVNNIGNLYIIAVPNSNCYCQC